MTTLMLHDLQAEIDRVEVRVGRVETEEDELKSALEGGGSYLGSTDRNELMKHLKSLRREKEGLRKEKQDLRKEKRQLRDHQLLLLRQSGKAASITQWLGEGSSSSSSSSSPRSSSNSSRHKNIRQLRSEDGDDEATAGAPQATEAPSAEDHQQEEQETPKGGMTIYVKNLSGTTHTITCGAGDTILSVKLKIQDQQGVPIEEQRIIFGGKQLDDERRLDACNIRNRSSLFLVTRLRGGKPVILLYPSAPLDATVALELSPLWSFSALYPSPPSNKLQQAAQAGSQECRWSVHASPNGSLQDLSTGRAYPYLFWEADSADGGVSRSFGLDETKSFCVAGHTAGVFLDGALQRLGLNARERCDMITYWLAQLESSAFNVIYFVQTARYEQAARLTIVPAPDVTIRVFMAFRGVSAYDAELDTAEVEDLQAPDRKGFVAVEWGGMNLNGMVQR